MNVTASFSNTAIEHVLYTIKPPGAKQSIAAKISSF